MQKYWMNFVDGERGGTHKHRNLKAAKVEAERLARLNPGKIVTVLESVCFVKIDVPTPPPCVWLIVESENQDIP